ncbi:MAG: hypothetical protein JWO19_110 [Bryobacterales bacterium]|nr:hypothetical protein [Bryobacterales bacterium]
MATEGAEPDETTSNPKRASAFVKGAYGPGSLALRLEPDRIDWLLGVPEVDLATQPPEFVIPGVAFELMDQFNALITRWLTANDVPEITRIAFGTVLQHPVGSRQAGYDQLADYIPVQIEQGSSDFLLQINPPTIESTTGIPNLRLNRLNKWSVAAHGFVMVNLSLAEGATHTHPQLQDTFIRLELDVNTIGTFTGALPRPRLADICRELVGQAKAISTEGIIR